MNGTTAATAPVVRTSSLKRFRVLLAIGTSEHDTEVRSTNISARDFTEAGGVAERYAMRIPNASVASITLV